MSQLSSKYKPAEVENKWYDVWMQNGFFRSTPNPDKKPYTIVIPPPNVTGVLHMGHMLNNTIQDVLIRKKRMQGFEACWVPGTDHASIATEARVVAMLRERGLRKSELGREEFLRHAWAWKEKYGGIILEQLKKLGASCDWDRTCFTMDEPRYRSVIKVFVDLYRKGRIYRGVRMVNWDPQARTAVSDEEVLYREEQGKLYFVRYRVEESDEYVTVATTRPETILGDTAVCVNPADERYRHLVGKRVTVPMIHRSVPVIEDEYVDMEFGTGCLKITPAHDINDYEIGLRHNLEVIDILNEDGTLSAAAGIMVGMDRFEARKASVKLLEDEGALVKSEDYVNKVGRSERTDAVIEPRLSMQWFLAMKEISQPALDAVLSGEVKLHPAKFVNTYRHWMENVKDWCISRQLWWGHRIPAWYLPGSNEFVVAETEEEALELARKLSGNPDLALADLRQDEDVLDTWFSSWLWPISVYDGINKPQKNPDLDYFYPTDDLVTAPEILFFWVARMIIAGYEYKGRKPFSNVYLTGIVRDKLGRKMSKSLGNSPDPLELMECYGADGVRVGMLFSSPAGNDLLFDEKLCEQGRNFSNKIWNALRLVCGWEVQDVEASDSSTVAARWFESALNQEIAEVEDLFAKYRISDALMAIYKLIWDDFCSWYLEMVKPEYGRPIDARTYGKTVELFERLMQLLHPFMPFISEEVWHRLRERQSGDCIMVSAWPEAGQVDEEMIQGANLTRQVVNNLRNIRQSKNIPPKSPMHLYLRARDLNIYYPFAAIIRKLGNIESVDVIGEKLAGTTSFLVGTDEWYVPLEDDLDPEKEKDLIRKELEYFMGFLNSVGKKLSNEKFVQNAPTEVVENERKKQADAESKIRSLEERLAHLGG